jgi:PAS domain S-box-containing protein
MNCKDICESSVNILSSLLNYQIAIVGLFTENGTIKHISHKGIAQQSVSLQNSLERLAKHIYKTIDAPEIINCEYSEDTVLRPNLRIEMGKFFLVVPMKTTIQNQEKIIGFVLAAKPSRHYNREIDIMALDITASLITGAILSCKMRTNIESSNKAFKIEIAERIKTEQQLYKSEMQKQAILDASIDMIMYVDTEMRIKWANKKAAEVVNTKPHKLIGHKCHKIFQNSDMPCPDCPCERALETGQVEYGIKYQPAMNVVGESYWEDYGVPIKNESGEVIGLIEIARNITDRVRTENALKESQELYRTIFENTGNAAIIVDDDMTIALANAEYAKLSGYSKDEIEGKKTFTDFVLENDVERLKEYHYFRRININAAPKRYEFSFIDKRGNIRNIISNVAMIPNTKRSIMSLVDISEHKVLKDQLYHAQKMQAVGQLAGGIAHDFNNILTAIIGYAHFIKMNVERDNQLYKYVDNILIASDKAANLTRQLLAYSRKQVMDMRPIDLNGILVSMENLISTLIGEDIRLSITLSDKELPVLVDQGQIEQVIMNLIANARDAMPQKGDLIIKTESVNMDHEFVKVHSYGVPGLYASISVEDTGCGMDKITEEKIFEPFFTTKEVGKGVGLGLSMAYGIIKQHEGYITVYSDQGFGTTLKIYLPLIRLPLDEEKSESFSIIDFKGNETLLLAEDDESVRKLLKDIICQCGYKIIESTDGRDAIEKFNEHRDDIKLLIFDIIMPKMNGKEAFEEIQRIKPDVQAIFMSGYATENIMKRGLITTKTKFLLKPVAPSELLKIIREVLDTMKN